MKIIIKNQSKLNVLDCLGRVERVIKFGTISNNKTEYCYCTTFKDSRVLYKKTKTNSSVFTVINLEYC